MKKGFQTLIVLAFALGLYCLAPINNPPGGTGATGPAGPSGSPGPQGSPGPTPAAAYLVYTALLTQSGMDAPVATVLQNTLGITISWTYHDVGSYNAVPSVDFTDINNVGMRFGLATDAGLITQVSFKRGASSNSFLRIITTGGGGTPEDSIMAGTLVEILVPNP